MKLTPLAATLCLLIFLYSCNGNGENKDTDYLSRSITDSTSVTGLSVDSVKLVKKATINFKVKNVEQGIKEVSALAKNFGGMLHDLHFESVENDRNELKLSEDSLLVITAITPLADITARIPSEHLEAFLYGVADLGYYTGSSRLQIDDKSLQYLENVLKQKNRNEAVTLSKNDTNPKSTRQTIAVKDESIDQYIENRNIQAEVDYSTIHLSLFQNAVVRNETIANTHIAAYQLPFGERLHQAVSNGWQYFLGFIIAIAHLWVFIFFGIISVIVYRVWQQKRKLKLN